MAHKHSFYYHDIKFEYHPYKETPFDLRCDCGATPESDQAQLPIAQAIKVMNSQAKRIEELENEIEERAEAADERDQLIMAVGSKYPGESRFETALRIIQENQLQITGEAKAALRREE